MLISAVPSLDLPAWDPRQDERRYNQHVQDVRAGYLNLDRDLVRAGLHQDTGFEACDLLGPDNELIHVKRARGSAPLSHLFSQALVSAQTLAYNSDARAEFTTKVRDHPKGRILPADFMPKKVIFGVMLKDGAPLTADTLFPFSQVALAHTATELCHSPRRNPVWPPMTPCVGRNSLVILSRMATTGWTPLDSPGLGRPQVARVSAGQRPYRQFVDLRP